MSSRHGSERVGQFVGKLDAAVRGKLPAEHWRIVVDFDSVKLRVIGKPPPAQVAARTVEPLGEMVGYYFTRAMIESTPDEHWDRVIEEQVAKLAELVRRAFA